MEHSLQAFIEELQDKMAVDFEQDMFSPLAGRIVCQLIFAPEPRSLQQLAESLGVTKSAVSVQVRFLEKIGFCSRSSKANDRRDYYAISDDFSEKVLGMIMEKTRKALHDTEQILSGFPPRSEISRDELGAYEIGKRRFEEIHLLHQLFWERISDLEKVWTEKLQELHNH